MLYDIPLIRADLPWQLAEKIVEQNKINKIAEPKYNFTATDASMLPQINNTHDWLTKQKHQSGNHITHNNFNTIEEFYRMFSELSLVKNPVGISLMSGATFNILFCLLRQQEITDLIVKKNVAYLASTMNTIGGDLICGVLGSNYS